ncbi:MAG: SGNH/GDSL hydrolase family protein [Gammaproteobacteria bacterium]|nr:SGNH/GDSL hydrolase family protein [Gammaproteobacteria bacterium]
MPAKQRRWLLTVISIGIGLLLPLLLLEVVLRFLPVNEGLRTEPVNAQNPVPRFAPNRTSTFSRGWNFSIVNMVRTNNYGFVNDQDYDPADTQSLIAVIGDSYVEAIMVPYAQTAAGQLAQAFGSQARVYSFGASGSALSQYLAYARYARDQFQPDALLILVVGNDFDESLQK